MEVKTLFTLLHCQASCLQRPTSNMTENCNVKSCCLLLDSQIDQSGDKAVSVRGRAACQNSALCSPAYAAT